MSDPNSSLPETLARLRTLIAEKGLRQETVFDVPTLSRAAVLDEAEVRALLAGEELHDGGSGEEAVKERVRSRLARTYQVYLDTHRVSFAEGIRTVAARLDISEMWARQLVKGVKVPSVGHLPQLAEFFAVDLHFFTDAAPDNLNRALQPLLRELQSEDPVAELMSEHGLAGISFRGLAPERRAMLAGVIKAVLGTEK
ncbi:transcriptional regulator [Streptomyces sp. CAI-85]|uniref:transcriptional regulator n=1 Tax=Streptomyces sp. CAI-85 TaxID=1472662 RepID=UPI00158783B7|nr:transcriptional regulator [Streptomyces sp. CAI-85]NUV58822.1 transcriptional regulator [Streptomyces sp. CAI-85]